jgi:arylsulfatase
MQTFTALRTNDPASGAPNVLVTLTDDAGFGATSAFGGPCQTPNVPKLAARGLT